MTGVHIRVQHLEQVRVCRTRGNLSLASELIISSEKLFSVTLWTHRCLFCDQIPDVMWDPNDPHPPPTGCSHAGSCRRSADAQLLQPRRLFFQEEGVLRETHHWVGAPLLYLLHCFKYHHGGVMSPPMSPSSFLWFPSSVGGVKVLMLYP